jgi:NTP pyrophosphatase (non-canonical NTP hydrolase)
MNSKTKNLRVAVADLFNEIAKDHNQPVFNENDQSNDRIENITNIIYAEILNLESFIQSSGALVNFTALEKMAVYIADTAHGFVQFPGKGQKLQEEFAELLEVLPTGDSSIDMPRVTDELADVLYVILHISNSFGLSAHTLLTHATHKTFMRMGNPNYGRNAKTVNTQQDMKRDKKIKNPNIEQTQYTFLNTVLVQIDEEFYLIDKETDIPFNYIGMVVYANGGGDGKLKYWIAPYRKASSGAKYIILASTKDLYLENILPLQSVKIILPNAGKHGIKTALQNTGDNTMLQSPPADYVPAHIVDMINPTYLQ